MVLGLRDYLHDWLFTRLLRQIRFILMDVTNFSRLTVALRRPWYVRATAAIRCVWRSQYDSYDGRRTTNESTWKMRRYGKKNLALP